MLEQKIWFSKASKELKSLEPVFNNLLSVHLTYILSESGRDCPYWYSERPHVGLLASAVWLSGGTALEEYGTHKTKNYKLKRGRCDLGIRTSMAGFECEAKRLWLNVVSPAEVLARKVKDEVKRAVKDVTKLKSKKGLALCFITPVVRESKFKELYIHCDEFIKSVRNNSCWHALIWIGVKKGLNKRQIFFSGKFFYPGLLLAIKEV
jgi:hypothetical protein